LIDFQGLLKFFFFNTKLKAQGQEVKFHEIKIQFFHEIKFSIMRSNFNLFLRSNLSNKINQEVDTSIMRSKFKKIIIRNFDLMIDLLVPSTIMRLKFKINYRNLVSCTCGKFLALIISHLCIKSFDLMVVLAANKLIMRSKFPNNALFWILISWSFLRLTNQSWDRNSKKHY
jgi:hypothetical protein